MNSQPRSPWQTPGPQVPGRSSAEAIWVGVGAGADFLGRDVKGKAVIIYSTFVPGGRSHSASDRAGLFNANARAVELGAAVVVNVMAVPGNGQFQPEGGLSQVPQFTLSMDEGFALQDRLDKGEKIANELPARSARASQRLDRNTPSRRCRANPTSRSSS